MIFSSNGGQLINEDLTQQWFQLKIATGVQIMVDNSPKIDDLKNINQKILAEGESLPIVTLKDGARVQTGTVATMLYNIKQYDNGVRGDIERELELSISTLFKIGLFDLFSPEEWINGSSPGRRLVGQKALTYLNSKKS